MAKKIIYIDKADYNTIMRMGTVEKEGVEYSYDPDAVYLCPEDFSQVENEIQQLEIKMGNFARLDRPNVFQTDQIFQGQIKLMQDNFTSWIELSGEDYYLNLYHCGAWTSSLSDDGEIFSTRSDIYPIYRSQWLGNSTKTWGRLYLNERLYINTTYINQQDLSEMKDAPTRITDEIRDRKAADTALQTAIDSKASQTDLTALAGRVTTAEGAIDGHTEDISNLAGMISGKLSLSGGTMTGDLITTTPRRDRYYASDLCRHFYGGTPTEFVIKTKIKYVSGTHMPVIRIYGYAYGLNSPIELRVGFYIYGGNLGWSGVSCTGAWKPEVYLFKYTENETDYVAMGLKGSCYFCGFQVDAQIGAAGSFGPAFAIDGWTTTHNGTDTSVNLIPALGTDNCILVPYKPMQTDIEGNALYATNAGSAVNANYANSAGNAATLENKHASDFAAAVHTHATNSNPVYVLSSSDTRSVNRAPKDYWTASESKSIVPEFKTSSVVNSPLTGGYSEILTIVPWTDSSGGYPHQLIFSNDNHFAHRVGTNQDTWGDWKKIAYLDDLPPDLSSDVNTLVTVVNGISSDISALYSLDANNAKKNEANNFTADQTFTGKITASSTDSQVLTIGHSAAGGYIGVSRSGLYLYSRSNYACINSNVTPYYNNNNDLGSPSLKWKDLYLSNSVDITNTNQTSVGMYFQNQYSSGNIRMSGYGMYLQTEVGDIQANNNFSIKPGCVLKIGDTVIDETKLQKLLALLDVMEAK